MIYGTDSTQLQRHLRFKESLLVKIPCYATPLEGMITKIVGEEGDEYVRVECPYSGNLWSKASDLQVIAILDTPDLRPKTRPDVHPWYSCLDDLAKYSDAKKPADKPKKKPDNTGEWMNHE